MKEVLNNYKAKLDNTTIAEHNDDLKIIKSQIDKIYSIEEIMSASLDKCIDYHDIGKVTYSFQNNIKSTNRRIRHEMLSASAKDLNDSERLSIISHHKELKNMIGWIENEFYEDELNEMAEKLDIETIDVRSFIRKINRKSSKLTSNLDNILLKGYLQYCDHLASAGIKEIDMGFDAVKSFNFPSYNSIQNQVLEMKQKENILIIAPTGLGKTATSLLWSRLFQDKDNSRRIYYLLPYTASINSLYKDMLSRDISASMLHSRVEYFLDKLEVENTKEMKNIFQKSIKQLNISTIYQIVKAMFSCKRYEMILSQLKNSIFIVDEIHCFDIEQLALLLTTLKFLRDNLGVSVCIMSASIPTNLQEVICNELGIIKVIKSDVKDHLVRHRLKRVRKNIVDDLDRVKKDLDAGKQVILCVNSVNVAQEIYTTLKRYNPKLIHSRFNTRDREKNEQGIKDCKLLIGTQAIEVSLDISYDVMYTEIAPFDALQQRFGRVNRRGEKGVCDILIYNNTASNMVYPYPIIERTDSVVEEIIKNDDGIVIEEKTQEYLDKVYLDVDIDTYNKTCKKIEEVIKSLRVATFNKSATDDMCASTTISVLPVKLQKEYEDLMANKKYLEASALFVNVGIYAKKYTRKVNDILVIDCIYDDRGLVFLPYV